MRSRFAILIAAFVFLHACAGVRSTPAGETVAIVGVTVVDPSSTQPSATDQTILITDGVILAVGPSPSIAIPSTARRIDARGKFAIPGP